MEPRDQRHRTRRDEGNGALGKATLKAKPRWVAASELGSERVSIARVDGNAAGVAGTRSPRRPSDQRKATRVEASERGQGTSFNRPLHRRKRQRSLPGYGVSRQL